MLEIVVEFLKTLPWWQMLLVVIILGVVFLAYKLGPNFFDKASLQRQIEFLKSEVAKLTKQLNEQKEAHRLEILDKRKKNEELLLKLEAIQKEYHIMSGQVLQIKRYYENEKGIKNIIEE